jgi:hypothetical protein
MLQVTIHYAFMGATYYMAFLIYSFCNVNDCSFISRDAHHISGSKFVPISLPPRHLFASPSRPLAR